LILIIANTLRIFFWLGKDFPVVLLVQSLIMIAAQLLMVRVCVNSLVSSTQPNFQGKALLDPKFFWNWDDFSNHSTLHSVQFLSFFTLLFSLLTGFMENEPIYFEVLGFLALGLESTLGLPQLYKNFQRRSTEGLSIWMVGGWMAGDTLKTIYFILRGVPLQFLLCGCVQIIVDIAILVQFMVYSSKPRGYLLPY
jgi:hypothetical protein